MRSETRRDSRLFGELVRTLLQAGHSARFRAEGRSMFPAIANGEVVQVNPLTLGSRRGEVVMTESVDGFRIHRVIPSRADTIDTRGDCCLEADAAGAIVGSVSLLDSGTARPVPSLRAGAVLRRWLARWRGHF